jgi:hypothetical protein
LCRPQDVDGLDKPGHDGVDTSDFEPILFLPRQW